MKRRSLSCFSPLLFALLLRQDAAQTGPHVARRAGAGKARRGARTMRARSLHAHGRAFSEPRSRLAHPQGRMPGGRATWGVLSLVTFFAQAKKVTRSPAGRVEALLLVYNKGAKIKMDSRFRGNDVVGSGPRKELDSSLRWNDEQINDGRKLRPRSRLSPGCEQKREASAAFPVVRVRAAPPPTLPATFRRRVRAAPCTASPFRATVPVRAGRR